MPNDIEAELTLGELFRVYNADARTIRIARALNTTSQKAARAYVEGLGRRRLIHMGMVNYVRS